MKTALRRRSLGLWIVATLAFWLAPGVQGAFDFTQRAISKSEQFIVYCPDIRLRMAVTSYAETAKQNVLESLGLGDHWKFPIVINLRRPASTDTGQPLRQIRLLQTDDGWKVEINVLLREGDFKQVRFPQLVTQGVLTELAYREHPPEVGAPYFPPPSWLVEGLAQAMQVRASGQEPNAALFRQLIETARLPKVRDFLTSNVEAMDPTSLAIHDSCSASLLDLLAGTPGGPANLARMLKGIPESQGDPVELLLKHFPVLGGNEASLEKWWTLGLAHFSTKDRHLALSVSETDARLAPLLNLTVVTDEKTKAKSTFELTDYKAFIKLPGARAALLEESNNLIALQFQAHPLLRPVVKEYQRIVDDLARGKMHRMDDALSAVANYRRLIIERMDKIDDYLNWYEATQIPQQSGAFDDFLQGVKAMEKEVPPKRNDAISKYISQLEWEFE